MTEHKTDQEMTDDYCALIAEEVKALEFVLNNADATDEYEGEAKELFETLADNAGEELAGYVPSALDWLNGFCLEFKTLGEHVSGTDWDVTGWKALRTFGGPNCWITGDESSWVTIETYWGGSEASQRVFAPYLTDSLRETAEG
jgi:hypothetical protein